MILVQVHVGMLQEKPSLDRLILVLSRDRGNAGHPLVPAPSPGRTVLRVSDSSSVSLATLTTVHDSGLSLVVILNPERKDLSLTITLVKV